MAHPYWPLFDLVVRTPKLELRYPDDDLVVQLIRVSALGIHDPAEMPFGVPWTDAPSPQLERSSLQHYWGARASLAPEKWDLPLAVLVEGVAVGVQSMHSDRFPATRTFRTGSWLARDKQGQGIGKEMRTAALHLGFAGFDAQRAESSAWHDNWPSVGVSRAVGYEDNGDEIALRREQADRQLRFVMTRSQWESRRRDDIDIEGLGPCRHLMGLEPAP